MTNSLKDLHLFQMLIQLIPDQPLEIKDRFHILFI